MREHHLKAGASTCHWGYFDAELPPVLTVASGARVTIDTVNGGPEILPPPGFKVLPEHLDVHANCERQLPGHILTGPVAITGAEPGDTLEVRIIAIKLLQDWGYNFIRPLAGALQQDFDARYDLNIPLDTARQIARLPWGVDLPLRPFFGVMGVSPPPHWKRITSLIPRAHGGNLDNKELVQGASLFLPVFVAGGMFSCGDGHAVQGDGEVNVTAIETALQGTFEFILHKGSKLALPRAETPLHYITMGMDPDLDICAKSALRDMIALIVSKAGLSRENAYVLCSLAADLRITQMVNGSNGVHCMILKSAVHG